MAVSAASSTVSTPAPRPSSSKSSRRGAWGSGAAPSRRCGVGLGDQAGDGLRRPVRGGRPLPGHGAAAARQLVQRLVAALQQARPSPPAPGLSHPAQQLGEGGHAIAVGGREIGAPIQRQAVGAEQEVGGPAGVAGQLQQGLHGEGVHLGVLFPVHLDADEARVEPAGHGHIHEALALHDMAPVAGCVAHAQQHRPIQRPRPLEGRLAPGPPVHRVGRVLLQIGAAAAGQAVEERAGVAAVLGHPVAFGQGPALSHLGPPAWGWCAPSRWPCHAGP